jgi:hypothetical protein
VTMNSAAETSARVQVVALRLALVVVGIALLLS